MALGCEVIAGGGEGRGGEGTERLRKAWGEGRWVKQRAEAVGGWQTERGREEGRGEEKGEEQGREMLWVKEAREEEMGMPRQQNNECGVSKGGVTESGGARQTALAGEWGMEASPAPGSPEGSGMDRKFTMNLKQMRMSCLFYI